MLSPSRRVTRSLQAFEPSGLASLHRAVVSSLRRGVANCDAARMRKATARIRHYADGPCAAGLLLCAAAATSSGRVRRYETVARAACGRHSGGRLEARPSRRQRRPAESARPDARRGLQAHGRRQTVQRTAPRTRGGSEAAAREVRADAEEEPAPAAGPRRSSARSAAALAHGACHHQRASRAAISSPCGRGRVSSCSTTALRSAASHPAARSVVSAEGGVADQTSGWKGREYVIRIRAQFGPDVTERYGLSADGKQLVEKLHIGDRGAVRRGSDARVRPGNETAPRQPPTND